MKVNYFLLLIVVLFSNTSFGQEILRDSVFFEYDKSTLSPAAEQRIKTHLLDKVADKEVLKITLEGHTDSMAGYSYNKILAHHRIRSVKKVLLSGDYDNAIFVIQNSGKGQAAFSNAEEEGRAKNRRVDIEIIYRERVLPVVEVPKEVKVEAIKVEEEAVPEEEGSIGFLEIETKEIIEEEKHFENDTSITLASGIEIGVKAKSFYPHKIEDVRFEIKEAYDKGSMIRYGLSTRSCGGGILESDGMVYIKAYVGIRQVQPKDSILLSVPASYIDRGMRVYLPCAKNPSLWRVTSTKLSYKKSKGKYFYVFHKSRLGGWLNLDKVHLSGGSSKIAKQGQDDSHYGRTAAQSTNVTIKSRHHPYSKIYFVHNQKNIAFQLYTIKPKKVRDNVEAPSDYTLVSISEKHNKTYYFEGTLSDLKYRKRRNKYIIKSRDYKEMADVEAGSSLLGK